MKKSILFMLFLLLVSYSVFGQISVSGKVVDDTGEFLPGATVQIKGTTKGTVTNMEGDFEIEVESKDDTLVFSFVGFKSIEMKASEVKEIVALKSPIDFYCDFYDMPLEINYWSGIFYNPYGISFITSKYFRCVNATVEIDLGYSTNFKNNSDFYGEVETRIFRRNISYKFQQTTFNQSETKNRITTHLVESSSSNIKIARLLYGIGHQTFSKEGIENSQTKNYGIHLGLSKYIRFAKTTISAKSFYWQDYWAWETNLNKEFYYKKLRLNTAISYRQTTQDFKEINLTLGYIF